MTKTDEQQTRKQETLVLLCGCSLRLGVGVNRRRSKEAISRKDAKAQSIRKEKQRQ